MSYVSRRNQSLLNEAAYSVFADWQAVSFCPPCQFWNSIDVRFSHYVSSITISLTGTLNAFAIFPRFFREQVFRDKMSPICCLVRQHFLARSIWFISLSARIILILNALIFIFSPQFCVQFGYFFIVAVLDTFVNRQKEKS